MTTHRRTTLIAAAALAVLPLAACSSSGTGQGSTGGSNSVSTAQLTSKLANEPELENIAAQGHLSAAVTRAVARCLADALRKDADPAALSDYVAGHRALTSVTDKGSTSTRALGQDASACLARLAPHVTVVPTTSSTQVRITG